MPHLPENELVREFAMYGPTHGRRKPSRQRTLFTNYIHCFLRDPDIACQMTINGWKWLKTAIDRGNLWLTALQPMDDDDDDDDGTNMSETCRIYNGSTLARHCSCPYGSAAHCRRFLQLNPLLQTPT